MEIARATNNLRPKQRRNFHIFHRNEMIRLCRRLNEYGSEISDAFLTIFTFARPDSANKS